VPAAIAIFQSSTEYFANKKLTLVGEVLVNGLGKAEATTLPGVPLTTSPEAAAGELVGTLGFCLVINRNANESANRKQLRNSFASC
jgi:hypothetical protein